MSTERDRSLSRDQPLLMKSEGGKPGVRQQWSPFGSSLKEFTDKIGSVTSDESSGDLLDVGKSISGVPSIFARADLFTRALHSIGAPPGKQGINRVYAQCLDEWKGLVAAFVLEADGNFWAVKRVKLTYTPRNINDSPGIANARNIYEPKGAFGEALFARRQLWEEQAKVSDSSRVAEPFIDLIYYRGEIVAGSSPESLVFTAPGYVLPNREQRAYINKDGKFSDPLPRGDELSALQLNQLHNYVEKICVRLDSFFKVYKPSADYFSVAHLDTHNDKVAGALSEWKKTIKAKILQRGFRLDPTARPEVALFSESPFNLLFNFENLYSANFNGDIILYDDEHGESQGFDVEFKPVDLLLDPTKTELARIAITREDLPDLPIHVMSTVDGRDMYFSIPLSPLGLKVFQRDERLEQLLRSNRGEDSTSLVANYLADKNQLMVTLQIVTRDRTRLSPVVKHYQVADETLNPRESKQLVVWPNFAHDLWTKYYFYSEIPHNNPAGWQAFPISGCFSGDGIEVQFRNPQPSEGTSDLSADKGTHELQLLAVDGKKKVDFGELIVGNIRTKSTFKYEIYESRQPFIGVELRKAGKAAGYVLLRLAGGIRKDALRLLSNKSDKANKCTVGIDFGSNNTCIAYSKNSDKEGKPKTLQFTNRRLSLFSSDSNQNRMNASVPANTHEMLFFQNDEVRSDKIKSMLTLHDRGRLLNGGDAISDFARDTTVFAALVKGGFTSHEKNIAVRKSTDTEHIVQLRKSRDTEVEIRIIHSMKWDVRHDDHKIAFLKNVLLLTYAELFDNENGSDHERSSSLYPDNIYWSYPGAMSKSLAKSYSTNVWSRLFDNNDFYFSDQALKPTIVSQIIIGASTKKTSRGDSQPQAVAPTMEQVLAAQAAGDPTGANVDTYGQSALGDKNFLDVRYPDEFDHHNVWLYDNKHSEIPADHVLTESQAVAVWASTSAGSKSNYVLGVDVGGSTSDFFILTPVSDKKLLAKQGSLRLAAGSLAEASKYIPEFLPSLRKFVETRKKEIGDIYAIQNLTGNEPDTSIAPYCLNLLLDKLESEEQLQSFYLHLAANCKPLLWVNLFVTGLTTYYLGAVIKKATKDIIRNNGKNPNSSIGSLESLKINFVGKGSRIYDWFKTCDAEGAKSYLESCFDAGFGMDVMKLKKHEFALFDKDDRTSKDKKQEVAQGLAAKRNVLIELVGDNMLRDVSGEDGFVLTNVPGKGPCQYTAEMEINPTLLQRLGSELVQPTHNAFPRFQKFVGLFEETAKRYFDYDLEGAQAWIQKLDLVAEVENNDSEFRAARQGKPEEFDFCAPLIILEGQAFLRSFLLPRLGTRR